MNRVLTGATSMYETKPTVSAGWCFCELLKCPSEALGQKQSTLWGYLSSIYLLICKAFLFHSHFQLLLPAKGRNRGLHLLLFIKSKHHTPASQHLCFTYSSYGRICLKWKFEGRQPHSTQLLICEQSCAKFGSKFKHMLMYLQNQALNIYEKHMSLKWLYLVELRLFLIH